METQKLHRGRLIDHIQLVVRDLEKSKRFYKALLGVLDIPIQMEGDGYFASDELFISAEGCHGAKLTGRVHLAFATRDQSVVQKVYDAGLAAGPRHARHRQRGRAEGALRRRGRMVRSADRGIGPADRP